MNPAVAHVLQFFKYDHLPATTWASSENGLLMAWRCSARAQNQETTVALRKLLESKDAAVRAALVG